MERYNYTHGGDNFDENGLINGNIVDFSASINPLGMPPEAIAAAEQAVRHADSYPDSACCRLTSAIAEFENVGERSILCAGGASDLIFRVVYAIKPKKVLVTAPSFADYERAGKAAGSNVIYYPLKRENGFSITRDIVPFIAETAPDMVFVCNPNNPTGTLMDLYTISEIVSVCRSVNSTLVVDECFLDFVPDSQSYSAKALLPKYENIVIIKAFTKIFAMPGLRLGYAICENEAMLDRLRYAGADWTVSNVAQAAGLAALSQGKEFIANTVEFVRIEHERMTSELRDMGLTVFPSGTNFILFHCEHDIDLRGALRKKGFLIRNCENFIGLDSKYYRIAVLTKEKNKGLIEAMKGEILLWRR